MNKELYKPLGELGFSIKTYNYLKYKYHVKYLIDLARLKEENLENDGININEIKKVLYQNGLTLNSENPKIDENLRDINTPIGELIIRLDPNKVKYDYPFHVYNDTLYNLSNGSMFDLLCTHRHITNYDIKLVKILMRQYNLSFKESKLDNIKEDNSPSIDTLNLSKSTITLLTHLTITTIKRLLVFSKSELTKINGIGPGKLEEIENALNNKGYFLKEDPIEKENIENSNRKDIKSKINKIDRENQILQEKIKEKNRLIAEYEKALKLNQQLTEISNMQNELIRKLRESKKEEQNESKQIKY